MGDIETQRLDIRPSDGVGIAFPPDTGKHVESTLRHFAAVAAPIPVEAPVITTSTLSVDNVISLVLSGEMTLSTRIGGL